METTFNFIFKLIEDNIILTYFFFFISNALQYLFPPYPSDVLQAAGGYALFTVKDLNPIILYVFLMAGSLLGISTVYWVGKTLEHKILESKIIRWMFKPGQIESAKIYIKKYGMFSIFISKFIPGLNGIIVLLAGVTKLNFKKTCISAMLSCGVQHAAILLAGYYLAQQTHEYVRDLSKIKSTISKYSALMTGIAVLIIIIFVLFVVINTKLTKRKEKLKGLTN